MTPRKTSAYVRHTLGDSVTLPPAIPRASPGPSSSAALPSTGLFGPPSSQSSRAVSRSSARVQPQIVLPPSDDAAAVSGAALAGEKRSHESSPPGSFKVHRSCFHWSSVNLSVVFTLPYGQGEVLCQPCAVVQSVPALCREALHLRTCVLSFPFVTHVSYVARISVFACLTFVERCRHTACGGR